MGPRLSRSDFQSSARYLHMKSAKVEEADKRDLACRAIALAIWTAFIVLCVGISVSTGLSYFDDAEMALVAQSLAHGTGYSVSPEADITTTTQFQPGISAGPTLIVPCAVLLKILGTKEVIPGLSALLIWASVLTFLFLRVSRLVSGPFFLLGVSVFCLSVLAVFAWQIGAWYAFLGEGTAATLLLLGHWILAMEKLSSRWLFFSGLCLGLAVQTKYLAALGTLGSILILLLRWRYSKDETKLSLGKAIIWLTACLAPTALFEFWKFMELGRYGYAANWAAFFAAAKSQGLHSANQGVAEVLQQRIAVLEENYLINVPALVLLLFSSLSIGLIRIKHNWTWLFLGLTLSVLSLVLYWIFLSVGWPRYLVIAMAMACFAISIPVFGFLRVRAAFLYLALTAAVLSGGVRRIPATMTRAADHGFFKATAERHARKKIVEVIRRLREREPIVVGTRQRAESFAVEFDLDQRVKFQRVDSLGNLPGKKIVLINHLLGPPNQHAYIEEALHGPISSTILAAGPYELVTVEGGP